MRKPKRKRPRHVKLEINPSGWSPESSELQQWFRYPDTFWTTCSWQCKFDKGLDSVFKSTQDLEGLQGATTLRLRFLFVFFFDLLCLLHPEHAHKAPASAYVQLANLLSPSMRSDAAQTLQAWVRIGRRYDRLAAKFGNGILIELPTDISRDMYGSIASNESVLMKVAD